MHFLNSLLVFKNSPIFTAQIQGGAEFAITPTSYLSVELNYKYNDTRFLMRMESWGIVIYFK